MSSDLKDARWQLAIDTAAEDGLDFFAMSPSEQGMLLAAAHLHLSGGASLDEITELARRFRGEV